jgi:NADH-quinone oxidoreductase subunit H
VSSSVPASSRLAPAVFAWARLALIALAGLGLPACERDATPPLVEVTEVSPREIEVGDRVELSGAGFPQGRAAHVTFRGTLYRPGRAPVEGASVEAEGVVTSSDRVDIVVGEALEERLCGRGDHAVHTTMVGDVEVAFASSAPGAPPLVGIMHGMILDATPSSVRASVVESRLAEGSRLLAFLGVTPGAATPRGLPIEGVLPGSPADRAGFRAGGLISAVDGVHVRDVSDVAAASARAARFTLRDGDSGTEETKTVPMIGYAGERIPIEYRSALLLIGLALAALLLLVLPAPTIASALELRVARRLRASGAKAAARALFGRGARAIGSALASVLVATFALGPHVVGADLDGAVLLVSAVALFLASRVAQTRGGLASVRAAAELGIAALVLAASIAGVVVHGGALRLTEIVAAQGGAPWEFAALRQPVYAALAFAYVGALLVVLRARDDVPLLADARVDESEVVRPRAKKPARVEPNGRLLARLGLLVASALGVAAFFGGWQLPGGIEPRSGLLQAAAALVFVAKTWALAGALLGASSLASPWSTAEARRFVVRRLLPALVLGAVLTALSRRLSPSDSLEAALGVTVVAALVLLALRTALRIRDAMSRPEPHASPFL